MGSPRPVRRSGIGEQGSLEGRIKRRIDRNRPELSVLDPVLCVSVACIIQFPFTSRSMNFFLNADRSLLLDLTPFPPCRHGAALKKNIPNLARRARLDESVSKKGTAESSSKDAINKGGGDRKRGGALGTPKISRPPSIKSRKFSEAVDIEAVLLPPSAPGNGATQSNGVNGKVDSEDLGDTAEYRMIYAKPTNISLKSIYLTYGWSQVSTVFTGGFPATPAGKPFSLL